MNDPFEDSWGDLAAEFGIDAPKPRAVEPEPVPAGPAEDFAGIEPAPTELTNTLFADMLPDVPLPDAAEDGNDTEVIDTGTENGPEGESVEDGEKKRRRRRRRRKKGDGPETVADGSPDIETPTTVAEDALAQPNDMLRDIIGKWDVPSWDDIVAGLNRPNR